MTTAPEALRQLQRTEFPPGKSSGDAVGLGTMTWIPAARDNRSTSAGCAAFNKLWEIFKAVVEKVANTNPRHGGHQSLGPKIRKLDDSASES
jgi:hypothetical protein